MSITVATPDEDLDDDAFIGEDEDGTEYNMRELMDHVYKNKDIIFTLPNDQIPILKSGLITRKGKDNAKFKDADIINAKEYLSFLVTPAMKDGKEVPGHSDVRVKLGPKKTVKILDIRVPNDEF